MAVRGDRRTYSFVTSWGSILFCTEGADHLDEGQRRYLGSLARRISDQPGLSAQDVVDAARGTALLNVTICYGRWPRTESRRIFVASNRAVCEMMWSGTEPDDESRAIRDDLDDHAATLVDLARQDREQDFRDLGAALGVAGERLDELWVGTVKRATR